jgi:uncharacterized protein (DUF433 family)
MIDWNGCDDVERIPGKVSGAWLVKGSRIRVEDVLANAAGMTPERVVAEVYPSLPLDRARRVIAFAERRSTRGPAVRGSD